MTQQLSALELVKAQVDPYAGGEVFARLARGSVEAITPEDDVVMRWHGLYRHRPQEAGVFMLRVKVPGGALSAEQLVAVAALAEQYGRGALSLTTRQNLELHWLTLPDLPEVFARLDAVALSTLGACGDQVRNVVSCPVAGLAHEECCDTTALAGALTRAFQGNPRFANLPRKFKLALSGCAHGCVPTAINDLSLVAARNADGVAGYALLVGGGLSVQPVLAANLAAWVTAEEAVEVVVQAVSIFQEYGNREQRGKARMKHLLAARGLPWFRQELETRLGRRLSACVTALPVATGGDHLGVQAQQEAGRVLLGIPVPAGQMTVAQLRGLAALASSYGRGRVRLTHQQNIILPDLLQREIEAVQHAVAALGFPVSARSWQGRLVACTGKARCMKAVVHTKEVALRLADTLDALLPDVPLTLRMSGCPHGCGLHPLGDIGLQGAMATGAQGPEERFDLWAGGGAAPEAAFARRLMPRLRPEEIAPAIVALWTRYRTEALDTTETFSSFVRRLPDGQAVDNQ